MKEIFKKIIDYIHSEIGSTDTWSEHNTQLNILHYVKQLQEEYKQEASPNLIDREELLKAIRNNGVSSNPDVVFEEIEEIIANFPTPERRE